MYTIFVLEFIDSFLNIKQQPLLSYEKYIFQYILALNIACIVIVLVSYSSILDLHMACFLTLFSIIATLVCTNFVTLSEQFGQLGSAWWHIKALL